MLRRLEVAAVSRVMSLRHSCSQDGHHIAQFCRNTSRYVGPNDVVTGQDVTSQRSVHVIWHQLSVVASLVGVWRRATSLGDVLQGWDGGGCGSSVCSECSNTLSQQQVQLQLKECEGQRWNCWGRPSFPNLPNRIKQEFFRCVCT